MCFDGIFVRVKKRCRLYATKTLIDLEVPLDNNMKIWNMKVPLKIRFPCGTPSRSNPLQR
jgi:hypothetical protein